MRFAGRLILVDQEELRGEIIHVDRFGNLISNIEVPSRQSEDELQYLQVLLGGEPVFTGPVTYEQAPLSHPFALIGSSGHLEVAVRDGSAYEVTGHGVGAPVLVRRQR
jgi:hypothetical protein